MNFQKIIISIKVLQYFVIRSNCVHEWTAGMFHISKYVTFFWYSEIDGYFKY